MTCLFEKIGLRRDDLRRLSYELGQLPSGASRVPACLRYPFPASKINHVQSMMPCEYYVQ